jgi:hypothetical protein
MNESTRAAFKLIGVAVLISSPALGYFTIGRSTHVRGRFLLPTRQKNDDGAADLP